MGLLLAGDIALSMNNPRKSDPFLSRVLLQAKLLLDDLGVTGCS